MSIGISNPKIFTTRSDVNGLVHVIAEIYRLPISSQDQKHINSKIKELFRKGTFEHTFPDEKIMIGISIDLNMTYGYGKSKDPNTTNDIDEIVTAYIEILEESKRYSINNKKEYAYHR